MLLLVEVLILAITVQNKEIHCPIPTFNALSSFYGTISYQYFIFKINFKFSEEMIQLYRQSTDNKVILL